MFKLPVMKNTRTEPPKFNQVTTPDIFLYFPLNSSSLTTTRFKATEDFVMARNWFNAIVPFLHPLKNIRKLEVSRGFQEVGTLAWNKLRIIQHLK